MQLGNFSVSLAVKDIAASRAFYETLGFGSPRPAALADRFRTRAMPIGLFQGRFQEHADVQSGWDRAGALPDFDDIATFSGPLKARGPHVPTVAAHDSSRKSLRVATDPDETIRIVPACPNHGSNSLHRCGNCSSRPAP
jgi:hypothetical protein